MKTREFTFESERDLDEAVGIIIEMREKNPEPKLPPTYTVVAFENETLEFEKRLAERGINHRLTYMGEIPDDKFVNA